MHDKTQSAYLFNISDPVLDILKGFIVCDVVHKHDSLVIIDKVNQHSLTNNLLTDKNKSLHYHCTTVVSSCDSSEPFLASCVPESQEHP